MGQRTISHFFSLVGCELIFPLPSRCPDPPTWPVVLDPFRTTGLPFCLAFFVVCHSFLIPLQSFLFMYSG